MNEPELSTILTREQRARNVDEILASLAPDQQDFNVMLLGFVDIIQSSFYNYLSSGLHTKPEEHDAMLDRVNNTVSEVMILLNSRSKSNPEDMVILSTVMIECIAKALQRQENEGQVPINKNLPPKRRN